MKYLTVLGVVVLGLLSVASADISGDVHWRLFKAMHKKAYHDSAEEAMRRDIFLYNREQIQKHNAESAAKMGYRKGFSHLSDWKPEELSGLRGFLMKEQNPIDQADEPEFIKQMMAVNVSDLPKEVDWRKDGNRVTKVKNQGQCGSCWAFATTGVLEGQQIKTNATGGKLISLSEQNIIDCSSNDLMCFGGIMSHALADLAEEHGIESEADYPYADGDGEIFQGCMFSRTKSVMDVKGSHILEQTEEALQKVVAQYGPVAVAIDATAHLDHYSSGVFVDKLCDKKILNHAVLVVGYGTDATQGDYWIIKNSWDTTWGDEGYFKLARNRDNMCGVAQVATIALF